MRNIIPQDPIAQRWNEAIADLNTVKRIQLEKNFKPIQLPNGVGGLNGQ